MNKDKYESYGYKSSTTSFSFGSTVNASTIAALVNEMLETSPANTVLSHPSTFTHAALVENYASASLMGLIIWEHLITLDEEFRLIWQRKRLSLVTVLFAINRYGVLVYTILAFSSGIAQGNPVCNFITRATEVTVLLLILAFGTCSALRAFALCQGGSAGIPLLMVVLGLHLVPFAINVYLYASTIPVATGVAVAACLAHLTLQRDALWWMTDTARGATIVADAIVLTITLKNTMQTQRLVKGAKVRVPLTTVLLRDGTIYFLAALTMNIAQLVVYHTTEQLYLFAFICALTAVLVSRFFFDIREAAPGGPRSSNHISDEIVWEWGARTAQDVLERRANNSASSRDE